MADLTNQYISSSFDGLLQITGNGTVTNGVGVQPTSFVLTNTTSSKLSITDSITSDLVPSTDNVYNIGSATKAWGNVNVNSVTGSSFTGSFVGDGTGLSSIPNVVYTNLGDATTQNIDGTLKITGNLIAENYIVSSSVTYSTQSFSSGSTVFGDSADDTHQFTGSVLFNGSVIAGSVTGSSFTGSFVGDGSELINVSASYIDKVKTSGHILVADGTDFNSVEMSGNASIEEDGTITVSGGASDQIIVNAKVNEAGGISTGQVVYISGATGGAPQVSLADNTNFNKSVPIAIAAETKTNGQSIIVVTNGLIRNVDTSAFVEGQQLYLGTAGNITGTYPTGTNSVIRIGNAVKINASTGDILVDVDSLTIINDHNGILRHQIVNQNTGSGASTAYTMINDLGNRSSISMVSSGYSVVPNISQSLVIYNEGYNNTINAVDGNFGYEWWTDETDSHILAATSKMSLSAAGNLVVSKSVTADSFVGDGSSLTGLTTRSLSEVLTQENIMYDTDSIVSSNASASLKLLTSGIGLQYGLLGTDIVSILDVSDGQAQFFLYNSGFTKVGNFGLFQNETQRLFNAGATPNYPSKISTRGGTFEAGVVNSVLLGGTGTVLKTDNTAYVNQLGFNNGGSFETILTGSIASADNIQTLQDASGTLALLSDINSITGSYLPLAGGTMTGDIIFPNKKGIKLVNGTITHSVTTNTNDIKISSAEQGTNNSANLFVSHIDSGSIYGNLGINANITRVINIDSNASASTTVDSTGYNASLVAQDSTINAGVNSSVILGGNDIIAKTNYTAYTNQVGFNNGGAFETLLTHTLASADNTQILQDKSGTIALLSDSGSINVDSYTTSLATTESIALFTTSSYNGTFIDYTVVSASNARAGSIMAIWNNGTVSHTETTTTDIGSTSGVLFNMEVTESVVALRSVTNTSGWTIKTTTRTI